MTVAGCMHAVSLSAPDLDPTILIRNHLLMLVAFASRAFLTASINGRT
jgi:hypothetical protein